MGSEGSMETASVMPDLTKQIVCTKEIIGQGGFGHVFIGRWVDGAAAIRDKVPLAIVVKVMDFSSSQTLDEEQKTRQSKQTRRELDLWSRIKHKNILPLLGIIYLDKNTDIPAFVSARMEYGNAKQFQQRDPSFSPLRILCDIIEGLYYLHTFKPDPIVHGDIKAVNVLINDEKEARLCDFGLSRILVDTTLWRTTATQAGGSLPWMSPELMTGDECIPTKESDIYAYAMTCYEIISGETPFKSITKEVTFLYKVVIMGERPERIECHYLDYMWDIITRCWEEKPKDRPSTEEVVELVRQRKENSSLLPRTLSPIGQNNSSSSATVTDSTYHTAITRNIGGSGKNKLLAEPDKTVTTMAPKLTSRRYLSVSKIMETEDEKTVEASVIDSANRRYLNVNKVLETEKRGSEKRKDT